MTMRFEKWQALGNDYLIVERGRAALRADARARPQASARGTSASSPTASCCCPRRADPAVRRRPADLQPRRLGGGAVGQRRARGDPVSAPRAAGPTTTSSRSSPPPARSARRSPARTPAAWTWAGREPDLRRTIPAGAPDGRGERRRRRAALARSGTSRSATPSARSSADDELEALDLPAIGPAIEGAASCSRTARTSPGTRSWPGAGRASARGSSSAGVGETLSSGTGATRRGGGARARIRAAAAARARDAVLLDGGELEVEVGEDLHVNLTGWAGPCSRARSATSSDKELHETE